MQKKFLILFFTITSFITQLAHSQEENLSEYIRPLNVSEELWNDLQPFFLPPDSHERKVLDKIFKKRRVLSSIKSMRKSNFLIISPETKIIVARHYKLQNYLIKAYLDGNEFDEWYWWKRRIIGSNLIRDTIVARGYESFMKTPHKWIYPLPPDAAQPKEGQVPRYFVLVVEDVKPRSSHNNRECYKHKMDRKRLTALYTLMRDLGLIDSVYPDNTPFCSDGKIAFLDTEHSLNFAYPPPYHVVRHFLCLRMKKVWDELTATN